jgi:hypothetical protein
MKRYWKLTFSYFYFLLASTTQQQAQKKRRTSKQQDIPILFTPSPPLPPVYPQNTATASSSFIHDTNNGKKRRVTSEEEIEQEHEQVEANVVNHIRSNHNSSSSSSSSSEDDDEEELQLARNLGATQINHAMNTLLIKLERQQARQNRYLNKVKSLNKLIKRTNRQIGFHANLLVEAVVANQQQQSLSTTVSPSPATTPILKETPQLAKRSTPFDVHSRPKQRRIVIDDDDYYESTIDSPVNTVPTISDITTKKQSIPPKPQFVSVSNKYQAFYTN